ncbi:Hypothetical predicted protein [Pelobates cultripes]|uniref:Uncharacterized protein n=1 Tax=Pelobates cultripes TaxID=61616 RepID=A0AAD1VUL1_PELCU|nr:Hypothetical predicted protein [Pelobates cultripes]
MTYIASLILITLAVTELSAKPIPLNKDEKFQKNSKEEELTTDEEQKRNMENYSRSKKILLATSASVILVTFTLIYYCLLCPILKKHSDKILKNKMKTSKRQDEDEV